MFESNFIDKIIVKEDTLLDMAQHMTDNSKIALVHQLPFTSDREGFAATFEKVILSCVMQIFRVLRKNCVFFRYFLVQCNHVFT